jgi:hypothetical protein
LIGLFPLQFHYIEGKHWLLLGIMLYSSLMGGNGVTFKEPGTRPKLVVYQFQTFISECLACGITPFDSVQAQDNCRRNGGFISFPHEGKMFLVLPESFSSSGMAFIEE